MNSSLKKFLSSLFIVFSILLGIPPLGLAAPAICGIPFDTNATSSDGFIWDAATFGGFNYPVNQHKDFVSSENWRGERLQYIENDGEDELGKNNPGNHVIGEEELVYSTRQYSSKYTLVSELGLDAGSTPAKLGGMFYYRLGWFGKPYIAIENDARQLANIVISQSSSDKKTLKTGETWDLGKGYSLTVNQVDVEGSKVWFSLYKGENELESAIIEADGTVENQAFSATAEFGNGKDQLYFITYVDSVFTSATDSFAVFKYTWLIDKEDVKMIKTGDEYQGFKVKEASKDGLVLKNSKSITLDLDKDKKTYFTDSWYFQTSDEGKGSTSPAGYILFPAKELSNPGNYTLRGLSLDTNETSSDGFIWNAATFGGFNYPVNQHKDFVASENWRGERLQYIEKDGEDELGKNNPGNHVIGEEELVYSTRQYSSKYTLVSELGLDAESTPAKLGGMFYYKIGWFGKQYITVGNDPGQLASTVISQGGSDKKILKAGETWDLGKGYSLTVNQVDVEGSKVWFSLSSNGEELESVIVEADGNVENQTFTATADFGDGKDQLYFVTYIDSVFTSATDSFAVFKYTWLIDKENVMVIKKGDKYQDFKVKEVSEEGLVLKNSKEITLDLNKDKKNYFTNSWYFQTSDEGKGSTSSSGYVIYPATDIVIEDNTTIESADNNTLTEETSVTDIVSDSNESENISPDYRSAPSSPSEIAAKVSEGSNNHPEEGTGEESPVKLPGFGIVSGILGAMICLALRRKS